MPNFDFRCDVCGRLFERNVPADTLDVSCPCSTTTFPARAIKQLSAPAFVVKGFTAKNGYSKESA